MRSSVLTGLREFPLAMRVLTAAGAALASGVLAVLLLANALAFWLDGGLVMANILLGATIVLVTAAAMVWYRMLPAVRWLGAPVTLGILALIWDLLIAFLPV